MRKAKKITLYIEDFKGILGLTCQGCNGTTKIPLEDISPCAMKCKCGQDYFFTETDIKDIRKSLEEIKLMRQDFKKPL